ncbi:DUF5683 domain-containing protein [Flavobacterium rhizosphaerae]|uniref:DUF5683 domain-containing protein n=1 Tax=Flavobacterium rhizosphaerae TaxID=3163298 RepID=A0ABW8YUH4_9FLAO
MKHIFSILIAVLFFSSPKAFAQDEELNTVVIVKDSTLLKPYTIDPLAPARAAFYSALVPGMGQIYNKKYWKLPLVYGGLAVSIYSYSFNNNKYHEYRDAYKDLLAGKPLTGKLEGVNADVLIRAQKFHQRNRDLSMLITVGIYILNIVDANVDAHLLQFNVNENLSLRPELQQNSIDYKHNLGLNLCLQF